MDYLIDENGLLILRLKYSSGVIKASLHSAYSDKSSLVTNILPVMSICSNGKGTQQAASEFTVPFDNFTLRIGEVDCLSVQIKNGELRAEPLHKLSVFETRIIGRSIQAQAPYPVGSSEISNVILPLTDLHTHLSAQVTSADLIRLGLKYNILYPTAALDKLHLDYDRQNVTTIPKRVFLPLAHLQSSKDGLEDAVPLTALTAKAQAILQNALNLTPESQSTFEGVEICYYLREPFTKDLRLLPEILEAVARDYSKQGIIYAELSSNAVLDIQWLKSIHDTLPRVEKETGVSLRFKAGLPRNLDDAALGDRIERYKRIAVSPYIAGADILGYEINKTSHMQKHLEELARWIKEHQPSDVLQIHAGENAKNLTNVREALQLAKDFKIRLQVGHSLYGIDEATMALAQSVAAENDLIMQFNIDSNLAINNIDFPAEVPITRFVKAGIPSVLSSDGGALYLTSAKQTALAALYCGLDAEGFTRIHATEQNYIATQKEIFQKKLVAFPPDFFSAHIPAPKTAAKPQSVAQSKNGETSDIEKFITTKRPIFFAGAGGSSWKDVSAQAQKEFIRALDLLIGSLDPQSYYFVKGRTKGSGVNIELEKAIQRYNSNHEKQFLCLTMQAESEETETAKPDYMLSRKLSVPLVFLPTAVTEFLKERNGFALFIGGRNFTRDFILASAQLSIPFALMQSAAGASAEKARIYTSHTFHTAEEMVRLVSAFTK